MTIYELRFSDGRGASLYTTVDLTEQIGKSGVVRVVAVAANVAQENALEDAKRCFESSDTVEVAAHMGSIAYAVRHQVDIAASSARG